MSRFDWFKREGFKFEFNSSEGHVNFSASWGFVIATLFLVVTVIALVVLL